MKGLHSYFKRKKTDTQQSQNEESPQAVETPQFHASNSTPTRVQEENPQIGANIENLEADPGKRSPIYSLTKDPNERENIRRAYLLKGPTQPILDVFPQTEIYGLSRRFNPKYYEQFPWLEYSQSLDACFCLYCYLFNIEFGNRQFGHDAFVGTGFRGWNKITTRLKTHMGDHTSVHNRCMLAGQDLMNQKKHIDMALANNSEKSKSEYRMRLTTSLNTVRHLLTNGLPFRGHDESSTSTKPGLFISSLKFHTMLSKEFSAVVLNNAPENHQLTSPKIQKDLAHACAELTVKAIIDDIGDDYFSLLVDESRDVSTKEQMAIVLRYVNKQGLVLERFVGLVHVPDTSAKSLKQAIESFFSKLGLSLSKCRGQGYDGANNMRGEYKGLKTLMLADYPSAYYIHCFAHQLQLALLRVVKTHDNIQEFFDLLGELSNIVGGSCKRQEMLKIKQYDLIMERIAGGAPTGRGLNQETTVKRPADTRWGSHYGTITSVISLWSPIMSVLTNIRTDRNTESTRTKAKYLMLGVVTFEFAFMLHLMQRVFGVTNELSQALQKKDQDLANAMAFIEVVRDRFQVLRDDDFENILEETKLFCENHDIEIPNMEDAYCPLGRPRRRAEKFTFLHYYKVNIFYRVIDSQIQELNDRFDNVNTKLIECLSCLDPRNSFAAFDTKKLVEFARFYPLEFDEYGDLAFLSSSLENFVIDMRRDKDFSTLKGIGELARKMVEKRKDVAYPMVYLLVKLALVLPVATASVERVFSALNLIKDELRNKMGDEWLNACMITYVEYELFATIEDEAILQYFQGMKPRRMTL